MKVGINEEMVLLSAAILQPVSPVETLEFIYQSFPSIKEQISLKEIDTLFERWTRQQVVAQVSREPRLFSLTLTGNHRFSVRSRRFRDKTRIFLLKSIRSSSLTTSGEAEQKLAGDSPALDSSGTIQEGARPNPPAAASSAFGGLRVVGRRFWPRLAKQPNLAGSDQASPDTLLRYYSFGSLGHLKRANGEPDGQEGLTVHDLALAIGITPRLISACIHAPQNHYRKFTIPKGDNKTRTLHSPRVFLKVIQHWILDYLLSSLRVHPACHSYQRGRSILTNANPHIGRRFVASIDVENFFGSVTKPLLITTLIRCGLPQQSARLIAGVATLGGVLPQGAPTSPYLSNLVLYDFDRSLFRFSRELGIAYTRYADDITLSGDKVEVVRAAIHKANELLGEVGLRLNDEKTRIISRGGQQRVTGVVVNEKAQPPRDLRRRVRAMFHQADLRPKQYATRVAELRGYLSYLQSFPEVADHKSIGAYKTIIEKLSR